MARRQDSLCWQLLCRTAHSWREILNPTLVMPICMDSAVQVSALDSVLAGEMLTHWSGEARAVKAERW